MLLQRIRQFCSALTANITAEEVAFIKQRLNPAERQLFYQMSVVDQRHALDAALIARKLMAAQKTGEDWLLTRAVLLHDVGKRNGELTILDRTLVVVFQRFWPKQMAAWALEGRGSFMRNRRHAFFVAVHHGERGALALEAAGCDPVVVQLVRDHHQPGTRDWRMLILQEADRRS